MWNAVWSSAVVGKTTLLSFLYPGFVISVAVEDDSSVGDESVSCESVHIAFEVCALLQCVSKLIEDGSYSTVDVDVCITDGGRRTQHSELELVSCEGEWACTVTVCGVTEESWENLGTKLHGLFLCSFISIVAFDGLDDSFQLISHEDGHDCRRSFVGSKSVVVSGAGYTDSQQVLIFIHCLDYS